MGGGVTIVELGIPDPDPMTGYNHPITVANGANDIPDGNLGACYYALKTPNLELPTNITSNLPIWYMPFIIDLSKTDYETLYKGANCELLVRFEFTKLDNNGTDKIPPGTYYIEFDCAGRHYKYPVLIVNA